MKYQIYPVISVSGVWDKNIKFGVRKRAYFCWKTLRYGHGDYSWSYKKTYYEEGAPLKTFQTIEQAEVWLKEQYGVRVSLIPWIGQPSGRV